MSFMPSGKPRHPLSESVSHPSHLIQFFIPKTFFRCLSTYKLWFFYLYHYGKGSHFRVTKAGNQDALLIPGYITSPSDQVGIRSARTSVRGQSIWQFHGYLRWCLVWKQLLIHSWVDCRRTKVHEANKAASPFHNDALPSIEHSSLNLNFNAQSLRPLRLPLPS